jgi:hypothetical protein
MAQGPRQRKAVLVMPDVGLSEESIQSIKSDFENNLVGNLERAGMRRDEVVVVVVVVVAAEQ